MRPGGANVKSVALPPENYAIIFVNLGLIVAESLKMTLERLDGERALVCSVGHKKQQAFIDSFLNLWLSPVEGFFCDLAYFQNVHVSNLLIQPNARHPSP